jgi:hypothetical protein
MTVERSAAPLQTTKGLIGLRAADENNGGEGLNTFT